MHICVVTACVVSLLRLIKLIWTTRAAYTNLKIESGYIKTIAVLGISLESKNEIEGLKISFCPQTNFSTSLWLALFSKGYRVQFGSNMLHENRWSDNNENHHNVWTQLLKTNFLFPDTVMANTECFFVPYFPFKTYPVFFSNSAIF